MNCVFARQFDNKSNQEIHKKTTALEILHQMDNKIDAFVAGVGTGGTISGVGAILKNKNELQIIAVEPENALLSLKVTIMKFKELVLVLFPKHLIRRLLIKFLR